MAPHDGRGRLSCPAASHRPQALLARPLREARLARLVEHFGHGNRPAYLRATLPVMESLARAVRLRELQARNGERAAAGQDYEALLADSRRAYKSGTPGQ